MYRKILFLLVICFLESICISAQKSADKIVGNYYAKLSHNEAKVKAFRYKDGYRLQIYWLKETHNADGTLKTDSKNPDSSKRTTQMSHVVLVDKVTYSDGIWQNGRIYDPTSGRSYKVELSLCDSTLEVKGKLGPFHKSMYWKRIR